MFVRAVLSVCVLLFKERPSYGLVLQPRALPDPYRKVLHSEIRSCEQEMGGHEEDKDA
jgi:hypothetical protein